MNRQTNKTQISSLAPLLLFVVFTTCVLSVLLTGADVYQKVSNRDRTAFQHRTVAQYITTRIKQSDTADMIYVGNFNDNPGLHSVSVDPTAASEITGDTLFLKEELGGRTFYTRIYCNEGYLRELFAQAGLEFAPAMGVQILELESLQFTMRGDLIYVQITYTDASTETLILHRHSGKEVTP
jgi:hypothetical protein